MIEGVLPPFVQKLHDQVPKVVLVLEKIIPPMRSAFPKLIKITPQWLNGLSQGHQYELTAWGLDGWVTSSPRLSNHR